VELPAAVHFDVQNAWRNPQMSELVQIAPGVAFCKRWALDRGPSCFHARAARVS